MGSPKSPNDTILAQIYLIRNWSAQKLTLNRGLTLFRNDTIGGSTVVQGEASFTQRMVLRPGCQGNEFETELLLCTIKRPLNEEKILMDFFCDLKFLLIK